MSKRSEVVTSLPAPPISKFLFADTRLSWVWLILRIYVSWEWLEAGWAKVNSPLWVGSTAGGALIGFVKGALQKSSGAHPDVSGWYAVWLKDVVLPNASLFSHMVAFGELAVGLGLFFGLFTGIAAFFGATMNMNYLFAGTVSINPIMVLIQLFLILAWRVAGWIGLDQWILPMIGTPWKPGSFFSSKN
jgi:thiosulfate dehydrogenase (quinone) large subunit